MKKIYLATLICYGIAVTSCVKDLICIDGNGINGSESREATEIFHLVNTTAVDVEYVKADSTSITVRAESNLIGHIVTNVSNGKLEVRTDPRNACFDYHQRPVVTVTSPELRILEVTGSGNAEADSLSGSRVEMKVTGSGDLKAGYISAGELAITITGSGNADISLAESDDAELTVTASGDLGIKGNSANGRIKITGSGNVESGEFILTTAHETITGSGDIRTQVLNSLTAVITGSGNIYLRGNPTVNQTTTGSGRVINY